MQQCPKSQASGIPTKHVQENKSNNSRFATSHNQIFLFTLSIPTQKPFLHKKCNLFLPPPRLSSLQHCKCTARILQFGSAGANAERFGIARAGHDKHTLPASTAEILWVWALPGYVAMGNAGVAHCRDTLLSGAAGILPGCCWLLLGTAGILGSCALQGCFASGQCRDTLPWAPQEYCGVGHCRDILLSGAAGIPSGCCHYCAVTGHCRDTLPLVFGHCRDKDTLRLRTAGIRCH